MKRSVILCACVMVLAWIGSSVGQPAPGVPPAGGHPGRGMRRMRGVGGGMPVGPAPIRMTGPLMQKQVVATTDGGVVVVIGNRLLKYDKNLKKIGEAEIDISEQEIADMQAKMKKCCEIMMQRMKQQQEDEKE